jgi:hypothetical protein
MDYPAWKLDDYSLRPLSAPAHVTVEEDESDTHDIALAITGDVFRWMVNHAPLETLHRVRAPVGCLIYGRVLLVLDVGQNANLCAYVTR